MSASLSTWAPSPGEATKVSNRTVSSGSKAKKASIGGAVRCGNCINDIRFSRRSNLFCNGIVKVQTLVSCRNDATTRLMGSFRNTISSCLTLYRRGRARPRHTCGKDFGIHVSPRLRGRTIVFTVTRGVDLGDLIRGSVRRTIRTN